MTQPRRQPAPSPQAEAPPAASVEARPSPIRVALAGNPNAGKTSLFNALTGAHQHVGNYPGVTVERRTGSFEDHGRRFELLDLPGTYSLTSYSPEERIAQDALLARQHDVVVVVVDESTVKRGLLILAQIAETGARRVLALNMADEARRAGLRLDIEQMRVLLGIPVVETVAPRGEGLKELREAIVQAFDGPPQPSRLVLGELLDGALDAIARHLHETRFHPDVRRWVANKLLLEEPSFLESVRGMPGGPEAIAEATRQRERLESETRMDVTLYVADRLYGFINGLLREVLVAPPRADAHAVSDRIDAVLVHKVWGLPIFALIVYGIFWMTFSLGQAPMDWIDAGFNALGGWVAGLWPAGAVSPLRSLLVDGVIAGVGGVLVFVPNIILLFLGLSLLEDTGYMGRAAFLMDRVMHRFKLHGRSFLPMMTGFGCTIPGIMATRTLENERDRLTTMLVLPLMSCGARLTIWLLLVPSFFAPQWQALALFSIYAFGVVLALFLALLLRKTVLKGEEAPFVMELPPYRVPTAKAILRKVGERAWLYLRKAGTVILGISILLWLATAYPEPSEYAVDRAASAGQVVVVPDGADAPQAAPGVRVLTETQADHERASERLTHSVAGHVGRLMEPLIKPLGFDWRMGTAMVGAFAAKEVFVSQMGIVYSIGEEVSEDSDGLRGAIRSHYSPLVGLSLILFLLVGTPCMATFAVTRRESGSWRWAALQWFGLTGLAYLLALVVYQGGTLLGF